jgi:hypothetical protein
MAAYTRLLQICFLAANVVSLFVSRLLPSNRSTRYVVPSLKLFVPYSDRPRLPSPWLISHGFSNCSLLKAACSEWFPDKVRAGPGVPQSFLFFSVGCALDVSSSH